MAYSTFRENGYKPDKFDDLEFHLSFLAKRPSYIVGIIKEGHDDKIIQEKLKEASGLKCFFSLNIFTGIAVEGEDNAEQAAHMLYGETGTYVGIVRYQNQNMIDLMCELSDAIKIARKRNENIHIYDRDTESLPARINKALAEEGSRQFQ